MNLTKASILLLYLRILVQRNFRILYYIFAGNYNELYDSRIHGSYLSVYANTSCLEQRDSRTLYKHPGKLICQCWLLDCN